jgi:hypothetical protein
MFEGKAPRRSVYPAPLLPHGIGLDQKKLVATRGKLVRQGPQCQDFSLFFKLLMFD